MNNRTNNSTPYLLFYQRCTDTDSGSAGTTSTANCSKKHDLNYLENTKWGGMLQLMGNSVHAAHRPEIKKVEPPVDEDGFTLVVSKKNRKNNRRAT